MNFQIRTQVKLVISIFFVTFVIILPPLLEDDPNSLYYIEAFKDKKATRKLLQEENKVRVTAAREYLSSWNEERSSTLWTRLNASDTRGASSVVMCVVSGARAGQPGYLTEHVAELVALLDDKNHPLRHRTQAFVCNVEDNSSHHKEALALAGIIPVHNKTRAPPRDYTAYTKSGEDYTWCLNHSLGLGADFVLMLEDDTLPKPDMLNILSYAIQQITMSHSRDEVVNRTEQIAWVKLFHGSRYLGFISLEPNRLAELFSIGVILGGLLTALAYLISVHCLKSKKPCFSYSILWLILFAYSTLVLLAVGRASVLNIRRHFSPHLYVTSIAPKFFAQATLFPAQSARRAVQFMQRINTSSTYKKDKALYEFGQKYNLKSYYVEPNAFIHTGLISSLHKSDSSPFQFVGQ